MSAVPIEMSDRSKLIQWLIGISIAVVAWFIAYSQLSDFADWLVGRKLDQALIDTAVDRARAAVQPIDDLRASAAYRRALAGNLLRRFLLQVRHG